MQNEPLLHVELVLYVNFFRTNPAKSLSLFRMEDDEKMSSLLPVPPGMQSIPFQENELLHLHRLLAECEPVTSLYTSETIDPTMLGFVPTGSWTSKTVSLQYLHDTYFSRKNNINRRFEHKLWNCLRITSVYPSMTKIVGVIWVSETVIKVYKHQFAKFLNINCVDGGLFHKQGNFTRHGFTMVNEHTARQMLTEDVLSDVDFREVVLIAHKDSTFTMTSSERTISNCKWDNPAGATRVASLRPDQLVV